MTRMSFSLDGKLCEPSVIYRSLHQLGDLNHLDQHVSEAQQMRMPSPLDTCDSRTLVDSRETQRSIMDLRDFP